MTTQREQEQLDRLVEALTPYIQSAIVESFIPATDYDGADHAPISRRDPALILRRVLIATDDNAQATTISTDIAQVFANLGVWLHRAIGFKSHPNDLLGRLIAHVFSRAIPAQSRLIHTYVKSLEQYNHFQHIGSNFKIEDHVSQKAIATALTNAIPEMAETVASTTFGVGGTNQLQVRAACKKALENQAATEPCGEAQTLAEET